MIDRRMRTRNLSVYLFFGLILIIIFVFRNFPPQDVACQIETSVPRTIVDSSIEIAGIWAKDFEIDYTRSDTFATIDDGFITSKTCGEVVAFGANTGNLIWRTGGIVSPTDLSVDGKNGLVYVTGQQEIHALSLTDGQFVWSNDSELFERAGVLTNLLEDGRLVVDVMGRGGTISITSRGFLEINLNYLREPDFTMEILQLSPVLVKLERWTLSQIPNYGHLEIYQAPGQLTYLPTIIY